jgi:protein neuralized
MSGRWSGVLRIGFSAHDPSNLSHLPKYTCPDLTSKPGYWAKALSERIATEGNVIHYYVTGNGYVHFGQGGKDLGVFSPELTHGNLCGP